jgi:hypothetical protein
MTDHRPVLRDGAIAGALASIVSGAPSTLHALLTRADPLEATLAAGTILLPDERRPSRLLLAAVPTHVGMSLGWGIALAAVLPRRHTVAAGALAGALIATLDLGIVGRAFPRLSALPAPAQLADHVAFGAVVGAVVARRRAGRRRDERSQPPAAHPPT